MSLIKIKRSAVSGKVPLDTDLELGELAINTYDGKLFLKKSVAGANTIVDVSNGQTKAYTTNTAVLSTNTANQVVDTFSTSVHRTVKYLVELSTTTNYHATEIVVTHNGTTVYTTEYATVYSGTSLGTIDFDILTSNVRMLVSPVNANTTVKFARFEVNSITGTKVSMLSGLDDVNIVSPANNDVLTYNTSTNKWSATAGGSGGGISSGKAIAMALVFG